MANLYVKIVSVAMVIILYVIVILSNLYVKLAIVLTLITRLRMFLFALPVAIGLLCSSPFREFSSIVKNNLNGEWP